MSVNDKTENRGTHGVSSSMLDTLVSSSENPLSLDMGSVKERVCGVCGKPFLDDSPGRKYCSPECARRAANEKKGE